MLIYDRYLSSKTKNTPLQREYFCILCLYMILCDILCKWLKMLISWRRWADSNRRIRVLQTRALPLGYNAVFIIYTVPVYCGFNSLCSNTHSNLATTPYKKFGAGNGAQTRDLCLGKAALYQLSYSRVSL